VHEALVPIFYATLAAACFGGQLVLTMRSFAYVDPQTSSMITIGTCVTIFWLLSPFLLKAEYFTNPGMWVFFANGLIHPLFSLYLAFEATKRMGSTVSATISAIAPLFATTGAVLVLGEHITLIFLMGTICTVMGIMILSWQRQSHISWALPALVFPLGAAAIRGANHNIGKFGLQLLPSPYFASLVSFTVSFVGAKSADPATKTKRYVERACRNMHCHGCSQHVFSTSLWTGSCGFPNNLYLSIVYPSHESIISSGAVQVDPIDRSGTGGCRCHLDQYSVAQLFSTSEAKMKAQDLHSCRLAGFQPFIMNDGL